MPISEIPIFSMLRTKMQWHQDRQQLLAENVSNADTPRFRPHDLVPPKFEGTTPAAESSLALVETNPAHKAATNVDGTPEFQQQHNTRFEIRPSGNAVNLEDEMIKVAANQMDYQAATALYGKSIGLIKVAIGR